jgi:hypothetical protein
MPDQTALENHLLNPPSYVFLWLNTTNSFGLQPIRQSLKQYIKVMTIVKQYPRSIPSDYLGFFLY